VDVFVKATPGGAKLPRCLGLQTDHERRPFLPKSPDGLAVIASPNREEVAPQV